MRRSGFHSLVRLNADVGTRSWGRRLLEIAGAGSLIGGLLVVATTGSADALPPVPAGAVIVSNHTGNDSVSGCATAPYSTIQAAVSAALANATIYVCAGTYDESVTITEPLTLDGAEYGVSAPSRSDSETVIAAPSATQGPIVYGSGAPTGQVNGFTLDGGSSSDNPTGISAFASSGVGYTWIDNIIQNNAMGINFNATGAGNVSTLISGNLFLDNNATPSNGDSGTGVFFTNGPANNVTIEQNTFQDEGLESNSPDNNGDINTTGSGSSANPNNNLVISDNNEILYNTSGNDVYENNFVALFITDGAQISGNTVTDSDATDPNAESAVYVGGGDSDTTIADNTITGGLASGINLNTDFYPAGSDDVVTGNTISNRSNGITVSGNSGFTVSDNTISGSSNDGIWVKARSSDGTVSDNKVSGSTNNDCQDDTTGGGTEGTANTWSGDEGVTSSPSGLCQGPVTVTNPTDSTITLGNANTDQVAVKGNASEGVPTGSVTFAVAGPCNGGVFSGCAPLSFQPVGSSELSGSSGDTATAVSPPYAPTSTGLYCFEGVYNGSTNYEGSADYEPSECFTVTKGTSTSVSSPVSANIVLGSGMSDNVTVSGNTAGGSPTGTVDFYECGPTASATACTTTTAGNQVGTAEGLTIGAADTSSTSSASFTPTSAGYWCFAAVYSGDSNYLTSSDTTTDECVDVSQAPTGTSSTPANTTLALGQADNDVATVTGVSAGGSPTGTASFYECGPTVNATACTTGTQVGGPVTVSPGASPLASATSASFTPSSTGYWCFAAVYSGDANYTTSSDTSTDECVDVTTAGASSNTQPTSPTISLGGSNTDGATLKGNATGGSPTGSVTFYECAGPTACTPGATSIGTAPLTAGPNDTATATSPPFTPSTPGSWCFAVSYPGDSHYASEFQSGATECFTVTKASTTTTSAPTTTTVTLGQSDSDKATVTGSAAGGDPTQSVSFYQCGETATPTPCTSTANEIGSAVTVSPGAGDTATATSGSFTPSSVGYWCFGAVYSGDTNYLTSSDTTVDECVDVTPASTTTTTTPTKTTIMLGQSDTDAVAVTGNATGGSPTGTVSFYECGSTASAVGCTTTANQVGSAMTLTSGANDTATATSGSFTPTSVGYWCFAGVYSGSSSYKSSSDTSTDECVDVTEASTTTTTTPTHATLVLGGSNTDTATVAGNATGGSPGGTVSFYECGPTVAATPCTSTAHQVGTSVSVTAGANNTSTAPSGSFTPTSTGYWCFAGVYSGSTSYLTSSDTTTDECVDVTPASSTTFETQPSLSFALGGSDTDKATVTGNAAGGSPTGTVSFYECGPNVTSCTSRTNQIGGPVTLTAGTGDTSTATSQSFAPTAAGVWCFAAVYSGDTNYTGSSDSLDGCVQVNKSTTTTLTTPTNATITLGQADTDLAMVTGNAAGGSPTGTVAFYECGPTTTPTPCTSTSNPLGGNVSLTAGANDTATATSASFTPTGSGYWCFAGDYSGDGNYFSSTDTTTDECVNVVTSADTVTSSTPMTSTIVLGGSDSDNATVKGNAASGSPGGTVTFYECGPTTTPTACTSTAHQVGSAETLTAGANDSSTATSESFTPTGGGYWCFAADYSGSGSYFSSSDGTTDECFGVSPVSSVTSTAPTSPSVVLGASDTDTVAVTGNAAGGSPTGTVTFYACGETSTPMPCTSTSDPVGSAIHVAPGANNVSTGTSAPFTPTSPGYWCFAGDYFGSTDYLGSSDTSTDECFHVTAGVSFTTTTPSSQKIVLGQSASDTATVTGNAAGGSPTGSVSFYECGPTGTPTNCTSTTDPVGSAVALTAGANDTATAASVSFTPSAPGYWCFAGHYAATTDYQSSTDESIDECFDVVPQPTTLTILTSSLPSGTKGTPYSTTLSAAGGVEPYIWGVSKLPHGLKLNKTTGVISGTPTQLGEFVVKIRVKDSTVPRPDKTHVSLTLTINS